MKLVLITGAAGGIGSYLRPALRERYRLRLTDVGEVSGLTDGEQFVGADIRDLDAVEALMSDVDAVVHLGAVSREAAWEPILENNVVGTYNVFEAARRRAVARVVFASSNHAVGFYDRDQCIGIDARVRPDSRYGVSKAFGEALGSLYADKYGLRVLAIRIGNVAERPVDVRRLSIWVSPRDLAQLVRIGIENEALGNEIVYGVSDNRRGWWDNAAAERLGYVPQDRSEDHAAAVLAAAPRSAGDPLAERKQGGDFVIVEEGGGEPRAERPR